MTNLTAAYTGIQDLDAPRLGLSDVDVRFPHAIAQLPTDAFLTGMESMTGRSEHDVRTKGLECLGTWGATDGFVSTAGFPDWLRVVLQRLLPFTKLPTNWDSYGSPPPSFKFVQNVVAQLNNAEALNVPVPDVVPMAGGGVQLEWALGNEELEIAFLGNGGFSYLVCKPTGDLVKEIDVGPPDIAILREALGWASKSTL